MSDTLGQLCWYTVTTGRNGPPSLDITPEDLVAWFKELDLDPTFAPKQTRSVDAFRVATSGQTHEYISDDGQRYKLHIVEHGRNDDVIQRIVYRQGIIDRSNTKVATITYYRSRKRSHGRIHGSESVMSRLHPGLGGTDKDHVQAFVNRCLEHYEKMRAALTPHRMRMLLRDYLTFKNAVPIKDGLYFVPPEARQVAQTLRALTARMGVGCRMMLIPLTDTDETREMLREAIDNDVEHQARTTLERISAWLDKHPTKTPTPGLMRNWRDEYRGLQELVSAYADQWDVTFPAAADALEELQAAVDQLTTR